MSTWVLAIGALVAAGVVFVLARRARRDDPSPRDPLTNLGPKAFDRARSMGRRDGQSDMPSAVTAEPFPTIQMLAFYEAGEETAAEVIAAHAEQTRELRVRIHLLSHRAEALTAKTAALAGDAEAARLAAAAAQRHTGAREALKQADYVHDTRLARVDSQTHQLVLEYWASNLAARNPTDRDNLASLVVPTPAVLRAKSGPAAPARRSTAPAPAAPALESNGSVPSRQPASATVEERPDASRG